MYFTAYQSRKRERSPPSDTYETFATPCNSPAIGLVTSPTVDVLAKRQRTGRSIGGVLEQIEVQDQHLPALQYDSGASGQSANGSGYLQVNGNSHGNEHELDMSTQYAEKRRARQWEQLNAPRPTSTLFETPSQPSLGIYDRLNREDQDLGYFSPAHHAPKQSRPQFKHHMSSSPIRHQPPGSSPFKSSGPSSQATARDFRSGGTPRAEEEEDDDDEGMDQEELRRDWGEHYARPNGLLLSLHRSRQSQPRIPTTPHNHNSDNILSSPYPRPTPSRAHSYRDEHDVGYDVPTHSSPDGGDVSGEMDNQYEETNRLLGQLELVRRQRFSTE